jgi:hypothetical protein
VKYRSLFSVFLCATILCSSASSYAANAIESWWFGAKNDDPRVIGLVVVGAAAAITGLLLTKKGIQQTFGNHKFNNSSPAIRALKSLFVRAGGVGITAIGLGLTTAGITSVLGSKDIVVELSKAIEEMRRS